MECPIFRVNHSVQVAAKACTKHMQACIYMHHIMAHWSEMRHACHTCQTLQAQWLHKGFAAVERGTPEENYSSVHMIAFNVVKRPRSSTIDPILLYTVLMAPHMYTQVQSVQSIESVQNSYL